MSVHCQYYQCVDIYLEIVRIFPLLPFLFFFFFHVSVSFSPSLSFLWGVFFCFLFFAVKFVDPTLSILYGV